MHNIGTVTSALVLLLAATDAQARMLFSLVSDTQADVNLLLTKHNAYRANHDSPPLTWSASLSSSAATWAEKCQYQHSPSEERGNAGENLAAFDGYAASVIYDLSVKNWYEEVRYYNYDNPGATPFSQIGHFTQLVWKSTTELGCARALCSTGSPFGTNKDWYYVVCRYSPAGNIFYSTGDQYMYFKENVLPAKNPLPPSSPSPSPQPPGSTCDNNNGLVVAVSMKTAKSCSKSLAKAVSKAVVNVSGAGAYCYSARCSGLTGKVALRIDLKVNLSTSAAKTKIQQGFSSGAFYTQFKKQLGSKYKYYTYEKGSVCTYPGSSKCKF